MNGVFRHVEALAVFLLERGHEVDLAYSTCRAGADLGVLVRRIEQAGGRTLDLRVAEGPGIRDLPALWRLQRFVLQQHPHVIHAHSSKAGALVRLLPRTGGAALLYSPHAYFGLRPGAHWQGRFYNRIERVLGHRGTTINVSESEAGFAQVVLRIPAAARMTIPNGVDLSAFHPPSAEERAAARATLGLDPGALVLGAIGRLCSQKDPKTLYRALRLVWGRGCGVHLVHVGSGSEAKGAADLVTPELRPHVTRLEQLPPLTLYHAADGLIVTSRYEGLSLVVLEAMACGLPLILSDVPGNDDILRRNPSHAHAFRAGDALSAAAAIMRWADSLEAGPVTTDHREVVARHYNAQRTLRLLESLYDGVLPVPDSTPAVINALHS